MATWSGGAASSTWAVTAARGRPVGQPPVGLDGERIRRQLRALRHLLQALLRPRA
jgi:hypothetical protein